ncbi:hypothetical protein GWN26_14090, partial [Candidatus Saccharibacteria bacterium]|nr:hypothetical protein [Candidatus Saccharibacteria bacterium]NIW00182.1 hypothetical protein [Candidatus Saccharibacteria bacterium]
IAPNGISIDVKTDAGNFKPKPTYEALVEDRGGMGPQLCHIYCFSHVLYDLSEVWLVGWDFQHTFYQTAQHRKKGERRESMKTGKVLESYYFKTYDQIQGMSNFLQGVNDP